jgi:hypothetical protein
MLLVCLLFCFTRNSSAQHGFSPEIYKMYKMKRNCVKAGTSFTIAKLFFSYEHAFTKHISVGGMVSCSGGLFTGYSGFIFTRYYFSKFNKSGWFIEARGGYSYFNPTVFSGYYKNTINEDDDNIYYTGKHTADISYLSAGLSGGYKVFCSRNCFFDFVAGLHYGKASFGKDDLYIERSPMALELGTDVVKDVFQTSGPAFPWHFMVSFGVAF